MAKQLSNLTSGIVLMTRRQRQLEFFERISRYIPFRRRKIVNSIEDVQIAIMERKPKMVVLDVSDFSSREYRSALEPFIISLPGWIKTFFIDTNATPERLESAAGMGVNGVLTQAVSRHALLTLIKEASEAAQEERAPTTRGVLAQLSLPIASNDGPRATKAKSGEHAR